MMEDRVCREKRVRQDRREQRVRRDPKDQMGRRGRRDPPDREDTRVRLVRRGPRVKWVRLDTRVRRGQGVLWDTQDRKGGWGLLVPLVLQGGLARRAQLGLGV